MAVVANKQVGFTLIELSSVLLIVSLLAAAATPILQRASSQMSVSEVQTRFGESLSAARTTAVTKGEQVSLCASSDGKTCSKGDWSNGWLVYRSSINRASPQPAPEHIIDSYVAKAKEWTLKVVDEHSKAVENIKFDSRGFNVSSSRIHTTFCSAGSVDSMDSLVIERTGRVHSRIANLASGEGDNASNARPSCQNS